MRIRGFGQDIRKDLLPEDCRQESDGRAVHDGGVSASGPASEELPAGQDDAEDQRNAAHA